ncbi:MAG: helix-turn-helix transcriptional regulator [Pyrinomonadaceae bacterium]
MKPPILKKFGSQIRLERLKLGLSQEDLAAKADVHRTYIGMIERGEKNITLISIEKVVKALNKTLAEIFKNL